LPALPALLSRPHVASPLVGDEKSGQRRPQGATLQFFNGLIGRGAWWGGAACALPEMHRGVPQPSEAPPFDRGVNRPTRNFVVLGHGPCADGAHHTGLDGTRGIRPHGERS